MIVALAILPSNGFAADKLTLNMRGADIQSVIQWLAETTGRTIIVDPRVRGNVTILARDPVTVDEAYEIITSALQIYGFAAIDREGIIEVVPQANVRSATTAIEQALSDDDVGPINYVMRLKRLSASELANALKPLVPPHAHLAAFPSGNSLLIADDAANVRRLVALAEILEREGALELEVVSLKNASAEELEPLVKALAGSGNEAPLQVAIDRRSNSLVLAGDAYWRERARSLLTRLDQPLETSGNTKVIYLNYLSAEEVLPILRGLTEQSDNAAGTVTRVNIEASESTNALIATAPPSIMRQIEDVVSKIDIRRAQVLVEAIIADVSSDLARDLGIQWRTSFNGDGLEAGTDFGLGNPLNTQVEPPALSLDSGLTVGYFDNGDLRALASALQVDTDSNILSTPSIVTLDNSEAEILVGSNVPFITGQQTGEGFEGANPFTTIERQDIGITLKVTPQINRGDAITLQVLQEVETLVQATVVGSSGLADIATDKRSINTKVLLEDDDVLVLGGLIEEDVNETVEKVPFLGDIPIIGRLFQNRSTDVSKRNLMVFIHTRILTDVSTAEEETRARYDLLQQRQQEFLDPAARRKLLKEPAVLPEYESLKAKP